MQPKHVLFSFSECGKCTCYCTRTRTHDEITWQWFSFPFSIKFIMANGNFPARRGIISGIAIFAIDSLNCELKRTLNKETFNKIKALFMLLDMNFLSINIFLKSLFARIISRKCVERVRVSALSSHLANKACDGLKWQCWIFLINVDRYVIVWMVTWFQIGNVQVPVYMPAHLCELEQAWASLISVCVYSLWMLLDRFDGIGLANKTQSLSLV